jgi:hypothetical protein
MAYLANKLHVTYHNQGAFARASRLAFSQAARQLQKLSLVPKRAKE